MDDAKQLEAYIDSMKKLSDPKLGIDVDLTAHPFSTGQTEKIPAITAHQHGERLLICTSEKPLVKLHAYTATLTSRNQKPPQTVQICGGTLLNRAGRLLQTRLLRRSFF